LQTQVWSDVCSLNKIFAFSPPVPRQTPIYSHTLPGTLPQIFVSGPSAIRGWNEFLILATSAAHRCPKPLLYHSGECPLKKRKENYWETQILEKYALQKWACHASYSPLATVVRTSNTCHPKHTLKFSPAVIN